MYANRGPTRGAYAYVPSETWFRYGLKSLCIAISPLLYTIPTPTQRYVVFFWRRLGRLVAGQLPYTPHSQCDRSVTFRYQLSVILHDLHLHLSLSHVAEYRRHLLSHSTQYFPPDLECFAGLGSAPYNLYRIISFDKLNVLDPGIIRQFCDLTHDYLLRSSSFPLSRIMVIANDLYYTLPPSAIFSSHTLFFVLITTVRPESRGKTRFRSFPVGLYDGSFGQSHRPGCTGTMCPKTWFHQYHIMHIVRLVYIGYKSLGVLLF